MVTVSLIATTAPNVQLVFFSLDKLPKQYTFSRVFKVFELHILVFPGLQRYVTALCWYAG
jgi:Ca2+-dependent lipid-binding protein